MRPGRALMTTVPLSIGSDSPVSRQWPHELQLLEYGRLVMDYTVSALAGVTGR
jgi:hypothetical protein